MITHANGSDAGKSPKSRTKPSARTTLSPATPVRCCPKKGVAYLRSLIQQSNGVPPRGSHVSGSTQGIPGGYHTTNNHRPDVNPPMSLWARQAEQAVHPRGGWRDPKEWAPLLVGRAGGCDHAIVGPKAVEQERCSPCPPIFSHLRANWEACKVQKHDIREPARPVQASWVRHQTLAPPQRPVR
jgi:hypothetical protein